MELIRGLHNLRPQHQACVATIGNFDGVHRGHQAVLAQVADKAQSMGLPTVVICFEPQPIEFFAPDKAPSRLTCLREKLRALESHPVDRVLVVRFDQVLASLSPANFIQRVLVDGLGIRYLVVGDDFRFGKGRAGDFATLQQAGRQHGFEVCDTHSFTLDEERVSSTRIRAALNGGDLPSAKQLLGRDYSISGRVAHGDKRGRTIGFPTANLVMKRHVVPLRGVYAVQMHGIAEKPVPGVANVGNRPTVDGGSRVLLETHLFDWNADIYGAHVEVDFLHRIRDEKKFDSFDILKEQIQQDCLRARQLLGVG